MTAAKFVWYDLMTSDIKAAEAFYSKVVGWKIADSGMPGQAYSILNAGDVMVGGMMAMPAGMAAGGASSMWSGYIYSADVDADARRAEGLGGKICKAPEDIPGVGRFVVMADPDGATFNLFKPNTSESPTMLPQGTIGQFGWRDLVSGKEGEAWTFYSKLFGWMKTESMDMGPNGVYQMFGVGEGPVGGMMRRQDGMTQGRWLYFVYVDAIDAAAKRAKDAGGSIAMEPMEVPGGEWIVQVRDPQGAVLGLVAKKR